LLIAIALFDLNLLADWMLFIFSSQVNGVEELVAATTLSKHVRIVGAMKDEGS
jgi:hypothetical protein